VDKIFEGLSLPTVQHPDKFEFVINLKAANVLGLTMPPTLPARAGAVIKIAIIFAALHGSAFGP
jgi:putative ABC transport system substrate-binding protein